MERIFGTQNAGYGQMVLGFARSVKAKVSDLLTALKLPKPLVNVLTWGVLIGLGLMLAGLIVFVTFVYFMLTSKPEKASAVTQEKYCPLEDPTSMEYAQWEQECEQNWEENHGNLF